MLVVVYIILRDLLKRGIHFLPGAVHTYNASKKCTVSMRVKPYSLTVEYADAIVLIGFIESLNTQL